MAFGDADDARYEEISEVTDRYNPNQKAGHACELALSLAALKSVFASRLLFHFLKGLSKDFPRTFLII